MSHAYVDPLHRPENAEPSDVGPAWYRLDIATQALWWSPGQYRLYGYLPDSVAPTPELMYRHQHPDDVAKFRQLFDRAATMGTAFTFEHRMIDASQTQRVTITSVSVERRDDQGAPAGLTGVSVDVSGASRAHYAAGSETTEGLLHHVATLAQGLESRTVIGRATGILMVRLGIDSGAAFDLLRSRSQHFNIKLRTVAELVNETGRLPVNRPEAPAAAWCSGLFGRPGEDDVAAALPSCQR